MKKQFYLTSTGRAELQAELDVLIAKRSTVAEDIAIARSQGDLTENAEYHAAKEEQSRQELRIEEIEHILQNSALIKSPRSGSKVQLGSTVKLKGEKGKTKEFQVVGTVEADPLKGKISDESPIGQALMGQTVGSDVEIHTPVETATYKIAQIS